jgi:hypothetical protein
LVGFHGRKWAALAIGQAVEAGHIGPDGDTEMAFLKWAVDNDRATFERLCDLRN